VERPHPDGVRYPDKTSQLPGEVIRVKLTNAGETVPVLKIGKMG
jgi:hypothetical protein